MSESAVAAASIAIASTRLESSVPFDGPEFHLLPRFAASPLAAEFVQPVLSPDLVERLLPEIVVEGRTGAVFHRGRPLAEAIGTTTKGSRPTAEAALRGPSDPCPVLGFNGWDFNYFHWLTEGLPAIYAALRVTRSAGAIMLRRRKKYHRETLAAAGLDAFPIFEIPLDEPVRFERIVYSDFLCGATAYQPSRVAMRLYRELAAPYANLPQDRQIYIWRGGRAGGRPILNEDELAARLSGMGIEVVTLEALPFVSQVALFAAASLVIGAHGAGLANIVFCAPGARVLELMPDTIARRHFAALSRAYGLTYHAEQYHVPDGGQNNDNIAWTIDDEDVARIVDDMRRDRAVGEASSAAAAVACAGLI